MILSEKELCYFQVTFSGYEPEKDCYFQLVPPAPSSAFKAEVTKDHLGALSLEYVHHSAFSSPHGIALSGSGYNLYHHKADKKATCPHYKLAFSGFFYTKL